MPLRGGICSFSSLIGGTGRIRRHTRSFIRQSRSIIRFRGRRIRRGSGIIGRFTQKGERSTHQLTAAKGGETFDIVKGADLHKFINALALGLIAFRMSFLSSVFSDSVSAISYSSFFIVVSHCNNGMKAR